MTNKYFNKTISVFLIMIFLSGMFPAHLFSEQFTANVSSSAFMSNASTVTLPGEIRGFNRSVFDNRFSRADRELSPDRWLAEARLGLTQVINAWELTAGKLYDNPALFSQAKTELEKFGGEELEKRFSRWLLERFFGKETENVITNLLITFNEVHKNYSWQLDDEGNIIFDDKTGAPLIIRPFQENREFSHDLSQWKNEAQSIVSYSENSFDSLMINLFPELLDYIPLELRATMSDLVSESALRRSGSVKREFENIAEREERIFTSRRTRDIWSLRGKSENEAARLYTERLIAETEEACNSGIDELNIRIEQASANTGDLALLGDEWLQLYKEQFNRGLKAWEEAEERFFIRRIEWEQESLRLYSEGEAIWLAAFNQFEEERKKWELKAKELFETGEMLFIKLSDDFEKKITEAKNEFALNMEMRNGEGTSKVKALIDMYLICSSTAVSAAENVDFWLSQYSAGNKRSLKDANFSTWIADEIKKNPKNSILSDIKKSYDMYVSYLNTALDARNRIIENYAELLGTGLLKDILSSGMSSEDFCLDEYQIALIRAKALVIYWERKTEIADAVMNYANELTAGRMTEAEGLRAWEEAKNAYNESIAVYESELNKLTDTGTDIRRQQELLREMTLLMQKEEAVLDRLNAEYSELVSSTLTKNNRSLLSDFNTKYNNLAQSYKILSAARNDASYRTALENGIKWWLAGQRETAEEILRILESEDGAPLSEEETAMLNNEYALLSRSSQDEIWNNTLDSLESLFKGYGFKTVENLMPEINNICEVLSSRQGDFFQNTAEFLLEFDSCFTSIPEWLDYELSLWKNALIQHTASFALNNNFSPVKNTSALNAQYEALIAYYLDLYNYAGSIDFSDDREAEAISAAFIEVIKSLETLGYMNLITELWETIFSASESNEKHWRQYLYNERITEISPLLTVALSWEEGMFLDSSFYALYCSNRINDSFLLFSQISAIAADENSAYYFEIYLDEAHNEEFLINTIMFQYNDLLKSAQLYELSMLTPAETEGRILSKLGEINAQENKYNSLRDEFLIEAEKIITIGSFYDLQYAALNKAYDISDQKRFEYEKQDAIQRWAGTAYLNTDNIDPAGSRVKLERAQAVLDVLSSLYSGESRRSYDNPEYDALYAAYEQTFNRKIKVLEAYELIFSEIDRESSNNKNLFNDYKASLNTLGNFNQNYSGYISPNDKSKWTIKDVITVKSGRLAFSRNSSMTLSGVNESRADELDNFFNAKEKRGNEQFEISLYEESVRGLSQRMAGYLNSKEKYTRWSLARDFLIYSLINANGSLKFMEQYFSGFGKAGKNGSLSNLTVHMAGDLRNKSLSSVLDEYNIASHCDFNSLLAWFSLSAEEQADLEFYTILTLSGNCNDYISGFSQGYTLQVYDHAYTLVDLSYKIAKEITETWYLFPISWLMIETRDVNKLARGKIKTVLDKTKEIINEWRYGLQGNLSSIANIASKYKESSDKLSVLKSIETQSSNIEWNDINRVLAQIKELKSSDINELKSCWELMRRNSATSFSSVKEALTTLYFWTSREEETSRTALETYWNNESQNQILNEHVFLSAIDAYVAGAGSLEDLTLAANRAYGETAASWKNHHGNIHAALVDDLSMYPDLNVNLHSEFIAIGSRLITLSSKTIETRYYAELAARETEWRLTLKDIAEKYSEWQNTSALILENGRADWAKSVQRMEDAYRQWLINFNDEYERIGYEWTNAYLAGLEDKEKWLEQAAYAANNASSQSFLTLIGAEAERLARVMDTREPFGMMDAVPQAHALMAELLQSSGITNLTNAFNSLNSITGASTVLAKRGMGGISIWNAAAVKTAASDLARKTNAEIADSEARKLAFKVRLTADEAVKSLNENVEMANQNFRISMDDLFIFDGLWRKSGNNYVKEIAKGSTLFTPVISEKVTIKGYKNFVMAQVVLKTNMDEKYLAVLDSSAINIVLENIYSEINTIAKEIFGTGQDHKVIKKHGVERKESPGKFGAYIGYAPATKQSDETSKTRKNIFYDEGGGELGRLMADYIYWNVIDTIGSAELALAPWDKRIWNDEGSWFKSPTLRAVGTIAGSIVAGVISGAIGLAGITGIIVGAGLGTMSDAVFGALDVTFGYKKIDEALFDVGKSFLTNTATGAISGIFGSINNGIMKTTSTIGQLAGKTLSTGVQTITSGFASNLISGFTYSSKDGLGYNAGVFKEGMKNVMINSLTSMTSTFTTTGLTAINSGFDLYKLLGFNKENIEDIGKLNGLLGSLAGQGVSYAMGNDFTLNLFNSNQFTSYSSGLLELNLGRGGVSMKIGTSGADVSFNNITAAIRGASVWSVNTQISIYGKENDFNALVALRAQYGYGNSVQKSQLFDILNKNVILNTTASGDYYAETTIAGGQKVINLSGYKNGMSIEDQFFLATILGHEAYRDGYVTGDIDASGNLVTRESSFNEFVQASIARLEMSNRINAEHDWFFNANANFDMENAFLLYAKETGDYSMFNDYLELTYNNDKDYFFPLISTGNKFQNDDSNAGIPLFNALTQERVNQINAQRLNDAFVRYNETLSDEDRENPNLWNEFVNDKDIKKAYGYEHYDFISIYNYGCKFMTVKYLLEGATGRDIDTLDLHNYIKDNRYFYDLSRLQISDLADIITNATDGVYNATIKNSTANPLVEQLYRMDQSNLMYLACLMVDGVNNGDHFIALSRIEFKFDENDNVSGISNVHVANPWDGGKEKYSFEEIKRWDIYSITLNLRNIDMPYQNQFFNSFLNIHSLYARNN